MELSYYIESQQSISDDSLLRLTQEISREINGNHPQAYIPTEGNHILIASDGAREILAFAVWQVWQESAFVGLAWTRPDSRRRGLYKALMATLKREAAARGLKHIAACVLSSNTVSMAVHQEVFGPPGTVAFWSPCSQEAQP